MNRLGYVYIIQSEKTRRYYIGSTINVSRRLIEHNSGETASIKRDIPWTLKLVKSYDTIAQARRVEFKIKQLKRRDYIERMIIEADIKIVARPDVTSGK